jgi:intracellular sulfur oxidation DsrE/DsrF family protein
MQHKFLFSFTLFLSVLFISQPTFADNSAQKIKQLIASKEAPSGVVFEIVTNKENSLNWALPKVQGYIKQLRKKFPGLEIAVVTHGNEEFALKKNNEKKYKKVHTLTQQLVKDEHIPVHVCGTYASYKGVEEEAFPDYVDVAAEGPATINDYVALGYVKIKI